MEKVRREKMQVREKVGKSPFTVFFQWFVAPKGRNVGSKAAGAEPCGEMRDKKLHAVVVRSTFPSQNVESAPGSDHFTISESWDVEKVHAMWREEKFPSENVKSTTCSDYFWKLRCSKSARHCGAKHISKSKCTKHTTFRPLLEVERSARPCGAKHIFKSKCTKHTNFGPLLEVERSKKCTPFWREAHWGF